MGTLLPVWVLSIGACACDPCAINTLDKFLFDRRANSCSAPFAMRFTTFAASILVLVYPIASQQIWDVVSRSLGGTSGCALLRVF
jgi:hypothetical protein